MRTAVIGLVVFLSFLVAPRAEAGEKLNCHVYDAKDPNPKVQRQFGALFRKGYEVATICGDRYGPLSYSVGFLPRRGRGGICAYRERDIFRVDINGKVSWRNAPLGGDPAAAPVERRMAWWGGDGQCPDYGDVSYVSVLVSDDVFLAVGAFWKGVRAENVEHAFSSAQIFNYQDFNFIAEMKAAFDRGGPHMMSVTDRRADAGWAEAKLPPYEISMRTVGEHRGWNIYGDVVDGVFVPRVVGFWIE